MASTDGTRDLVESLSRIQGLEYTTDPADCWTYGYDNSRRHSAPLLVAFPNSHAQVRELVMACTDARVAVTPRGMGSGTAGAAVPIESGLVLSTERMTSVCDIDADNRVAVVAPGITNAKLQSAAAEHGFFWPPDPTSAAYCTVGGNLALNSAGPHAVKYGTPRENTLGLRAVSAEGRELRTGCYTTKGVVGYDLTRLIVGSEGTLAIITEATLKLTPLPETKQTLRIVYSGMTEAARAVSRIMAQSVVPSALEFMDDKALELVRTHSGAELPPGGGAMLLCEVDGTRDSIASDSSRVQKAAHGEGLLEMLVAETKEQVETLWAARKALSPALRTVAPGKINEDVVVPVSRMPKLIAGLKNISDDRGIPIVSFGHAGNGNIHVNLLHDPEDPRQRENLQPCLDAVFRLVLDLGGTLSGEHGIGLEKRSYTGLEIEPETLELMRRIKQQFDPLGLLNPGK